MSATPIQAIQFAPEAARPTTFLLRSPAHADAERVVAHLVDRGVLRPQSRATSYVYAILAAPPEELRVLRIARRVYASRRTLGASWCCSA
jgi:hypothetical protein